MPPNDLGILIAAGFLVGSRFGGKHIPMAKFSGRATPSPPQSTALRLYSAEMWQAPAGKCWKCGDGLSPAQARHQSASLIS